jgi:hypothetical protein
MLLGVIYTMEGQFKKAEKPLEEVVTFSQNFGCGDLLTVAQISFGAVLTAEGHMGQGLRMLEGIRGKCEKKQIKYFHALCEYIIGTIYLRIVQGAGPISLKTVAKNIGFLIRSVPFARRKADDHLNKSIEVAKEIGAKGTVG